MVIGFIELVIIMLIVMTLTFGLLVPLARRRALLDKPKRGMLVGDDGEIVVEAPRERAKPFRKSGTGSYASEGVQLYAGMYRMEYTFASSVAVKLLRIDSAEEQPILNKTGTGSHAFRVKAAGRYVVAIDPTDNTQPWEVAFRQL